MKSPRSQNTHQEAKRTTYTVRCSNCSYRNPPNHRFCGVCGQSLSYPTQNVASTPSKGEIDHTASRWDNLKNKLVALASRRHFLLWAGVGGGVLIIGLIVLIGTLFPNPNAVENGIVGSWQDCAKNNPEYQSGHRFDETYTFYENGLLVVDTGTYTVNGNYSVLSEKKIQSFPNAFDGDLRITLGFLSDSTYYYNFAEYGSDSLSFPFDFVQGIGYVEMCRVDGKYN